MSSEASAVIGLQITDQLVRVARLEFRDQPRLTDAAELRLPAGVVVDGYVRDDATVAQLLQRMWQQMSFHWEPLALALGSADGQLLQLDLDDADQLDALVASIAPTDFNDGVVALPVASHHRVAPVAVALRSTVDRMTSVVDRAGLTMTALDTTPSALARTQPDYWNSQQDLALRYVSQGGTWSVRIGSTVHGALRPSTDETTATTFDAVGLGSDQRGFAPVADLAGVQISERLAARFDVAQLAVPVGAALGAAPDTMLRVDLRQATLLDRRRAQQAPSEPGEAWLAELLPPLVPDAQRRRWRR